MDTKLDLPIWPDHYLQGDLTATDVIARRGEAQVGSVVFVYEGYHRVFGPDKRISEIHRYRPHRIIGETKASWLIEQGKTPVRYPKVLHEDARLFYGLDDARDAVFRTKNAWRIASLVRHVEDADVLRKIAELINYNEDV